MEWSPQLILRPLTAEQKASVKRQENENDFEELVMKEKPDVTWEQVSWFR